MMERLTQKEMDYCEVMVCSSDYCKKDALCYDYRIYDKLAYYEDLEEQGLLLRLPCKVGEVIYTLGATSIETKCIDAVTLGTLGLVVIVDGCYYKFDELNETWFLTRAEAEARLKELSANEMQT